MKKNLNVKKLRKLQELIQKKIQLRWLRSTVEYVGGCDVSYKGKIAVGCIVVMNSEFKIIEVSCYSAKVDFPYIPTFLSFRELPFLYRAFRKLTVKPTVLLVDGQGIAHPRGIGLASHMGLLTKKSTIGVAKNPLIGSFELPESTKGSFRYIYSESGEIIGAVLRTRASVKPVYVSPGHLIDLLSSIEIVMKYTTKYRLPEPLRMAHIYSKKEFRNAA